MIKKIRVFRQKSMSLENGVGEKDLLTASADENFSVSQTFSP